MPNIEYNGNLIIYNNNPAGYIKNQIATMDSMFKSNELERWLEDDSLSVHWEDGVFEKLALNRKFYETELAQPLKNVRIWQLNADFNVDGRFLSYEEMLKINYEPKRADYMEMFNGQLETNDLEQIYTIFNLNHPQGFEGHSLSMSDVVELHDEDSSSFHYVDKFGFQEITFQDQEQEQKQGMKMGMQM